MIKALPAVLLAVLLAIQLAACGGGDDNDPTATTPAGSSTPAVTGSASSTSAGEEPTGTSAVLPESTDSGGEATASPAGSPEAGEFTDDEAALIDLLLAAGDLDGDWNQTRLDAPELNDSTGICDAPRFPRAVERNAEVEVEYQSSDGARFVLEDITEFPEDVAVEAMAYIRDTATCTEWTDDTGTVFEISPAEAPELGDESHAIHVAFQVADAGKLEGDFVFVRIDGFVTIVTTLSLGDYDPALSHQTAQLATSKIDTLAGTGSNLTDDESALSAGLLTLDDLESDWDQIQPTHRSDSASWVGLCDADLFPQADDAVARVAVEFYQGFEPDSATLMQLLIAYPTGLSEAAFDYEQEAAACGSFSGGDTQVTLEPDSSFPTLGDETFAVRFTFDNDDNDVGGYWIVIRIGDTLTTLIYTDPDELDDADARQLATAAAGRLEASLR